MAVAFCLALLFAVLLIPNLNLTWPSWLSGGESAQDDSVKVADVDTHVPASLPPPPPANGNEGSWQAAALQAALEETNEAVSAIANANKVTAETLGEVAELASRNKSRLDTIEPRLDGVEKRQDAADERLTALEGLKEDVAELQARPLASSDDPPTGSNPAGAEGEKDTAFQAAYVVRQCGSDTQIWPPHPWPSDRTSFYALVADYCASSQQAMAEDGAPVSGSDNEVIYGDEPEELTAAEAVVLKAALRRVKRQGVRVSEESGTAEICRSEEKEERAC